MIREYLNEPLEIGDIIAYDSQLIVIDHFVEEGKMVKSELQQIVTHLPYYAPPAKPNHPTSPKVDLRGWIPFHQAMISQITIRNSKVRKIKLEEIMAADLLDDDQKNEVIKTSLTLKRGEKIKRK